LGGRDPDTGLNYQKKKKRKEYLLSCLAIISTQSAPACRQHKRTGMTGMLDKIVLTPELLWQSSYLKRSLEKQLMHSWFFWLVL
jgi:hypothetical protein